MTIVIINEAVLKEIKFLTYFQMNMLFTNSYDRIEV